MELNVLYPQATAANSVCLLVAILLVASPEETSVFLKLEINLYLHLRASLSMK